MNIDDVSDLLITSIEIEAMQIVNDAIEQEGDKLNSTEAQLVEVGIVAGIVVTMEKLHALGLLPDEDVDNLD